MDEHDHGPVTRGEVFEFAYSVLADAADAANAGRATDASMLNTTASLAMTLAGEFPEVLPGFTVLQGGKH